jgi:hypothetical protein
MHVRRIVALGVAGGAVAAWFAAASTTARRPSTDTFVRRTTPVEMRGAELAAEIARLRERLRPTIAPQTPSRNLFEFSTRVPPRPSTVAVPVDADSATPVIAPPPLKLVGIAEDEGPEGAVRTAIISALSGELFFAKPGDRLTDRYQVARISSEAAEIIDLGDDSTFTLVLK